MYRPLLGKFGFDVVSVNQGYISIILENSHTVSDKVVDFATWRLVHGFDFS